MSESPSRRSGGGEWLNFRSRVTQDLPAKRTAPRVTSLGTRLGPFDYFHSQTFDTTLSLASVSCSNTPTMPASFAKFPDLPHFRCSLRRESFSIGEHSGPEESETGAPVHLTLDGFETIDLAFDLAAAP